jgi:hypothetical protein
MPTSKEFVSIPKTTFKDMLTPSGLERIRYRKAVEELNALIAPHVLDIASAGEEWKTVVSRRETDEGVGPSSVKFKAKKEGDTLVLRLDHRSETYTRGERPMYGKPGERSYWDLHHRTTVLRIKDGEISSILTGRDDRSDYYSDQNNPMYLAFATPDWDSFEPALSGVTLLREKTYVVTAMVMSLSAAVDEYATGLNQVP